MARKKTTKKRTDEDALIGLRGEENPEPIPDFWEEKTPTVPLPVQADPRGPRCTFVAGCRGRMTITEKNGYRVTSCLLCKKVDCVKI